LPLVASHSPARPRFLEFFLGKNPLPSPEKPWHKGSTTDRYRRAFSQNAAQTTPHPPNSGRSHLLNGHKSRPCRSFLGCRTPFLGVVGLAEEGNNPVEKTRSLAWEILDCASFRPTPRRKFL